MTDGLALPDVVRVVFPDANVLYSNVLRDYLLYAADEEIIAVAWSGAVLEETVEHLIENVPGFTAESGARLVGAMSGAFPYAEVEVAAEHFESVAAYALPDEDDRHVLAGAIAAEVTVLCTGNTKDFPDEVTAALGIEVMTPDVLLSALIAEFPSQMLAVHAHLGRAAARSDRRVDHRGTPTSGSAGRSGTRCRAAERGRVTCEAGDQKRDQTRATPAIGVIC